MRKHLVLFYIALIVGIFISSADHAFSQTAINAPYNYKSYLSQQYIQENLNLNDSTSIDIVDKLNEYQIQSTVINAFKDIEDHYNDRMNLEVHVGPGFVHKFKANAPYRDTAYIFVSFKFNLVNPKLPQPRTVINKVHYLKNYLTTREYPFKSEMLKQAQVIEDGASKYQQEFWWKRVSLGLSIPIFSTSMYSTYKFRTEKTAIFAGYDLGDKITLQLGGSIDKSVYFAVTTDVSTPLYYFSDKAISMLARMVGISRSSSYYDY
jgi:hypothetical protein